MNFQLSMTSLYTKNTLYTFIQTEMKKCVKVNVVSKNFNSGIIPTRIPRYQAAFDAVAIDRWELFCWK
jgi:carbohydrate-binding DOMON domain-containing protein